MAPIFPYIQTKIMNEGWASYWHSHIMRELDLDDGESVEFMRLHSSVCTPGHSRLNPYYVGLKIFEDIEKRFGREKIFEVRELESDVSFIRSYLTKDLVKDLDLFVFALDEDENEWRITEKAWERVRDTIANTMTNFGQPYIEVLDGDYQGRRELYLIHRHDGRDLDVPYAEHTLEYVQKIWRHQVHLESIENGRQVILSHDGERITRAYPG